MKKNGVDTNSLNHFCYKLVSMSKCSSSRFITALHEAVFEAGGAATSY